MTLKYVAVCVCFQYPFWKNILFLLSYSLWFCSKNFTLKHMLISFLFVFLFLLNLFSFSCPLFMFLSLLLLFLFSVFLHVCSPYVCLVSLMFLLFVFIPLFFCGTFFLNLHYLFIFCKTLFVLSPFLFRPFFFLFFFFFNRVLSNKINWLFFLGRKTTCLTFPRIYFLNLCCLVFFEKKKNIFHHFSIYCFFWIPFSEKS